VLDEVVRVMIVGHVGCDSASGAINQDNHRGCKIVSLLTWLLGKFLQHRNSMPSHHRERLQCLRRKGDF
jgi:hypothetical protein